MILWPPYLVPIIENNALHNLYFLVTLPEASRGNWLPYVLRLCHFSSSQEDKYRNEMKMKFQ